MKDIELIAKGLRNKTEFLDFQEYILFKVDELSRNDKLPGFLKLSHKRAGEVSQSRLIASEMLKEILSPFVNFREKREYTDEEIAEAASRRGL